MKGIFVQTLVPPEQVVLGVSQPGQLVDHPVVRDHLFSDMCDDKNDEDSTLLIRKE